jgi:hypothetical protein
LFGPVKKFRIIAHILSGLVVCFAIGSVLTSFLICRPLAGFWDREASARCGNIHLAMMAPGLVNLILEMFIIILPMPWLWRLQMSTDKKIGLTIMFGFGLRCVPIPVPISSPY